MTSKKEHDYTQALTESLTAGFDILKSGGSSLDAVETAVLVMEDSPLFNAGKGAVFTHEGKNEQDASIMDGRSFNSGAVTGVTHIKNPIRLARAVMEKSDHILLACEGAEAFAKEQGIELVDDKYFFTRERWLQLQFALEQEKQKQQKTTMLDHADDKHGTVGAVAVDQQGNIAAATSSGGMTNKRFGRVGDSPIIGAGTYADNTTCAVSTTGHGEYFMTAIAAFTVSALMLYKGLSLKEAAEYVIYDKLTGLGGSGGLIAIDRNANFALPFNTPGMYRGHYISGKQLQTSIFKD